MKPTTTGRRRPSVNITLARASRLHGLVLFLGERPQSRDAILARLGIGLRTFYRELELLQRCGVKVRHKDRAYELQAKADEAAGRLPFPDPQLSFAEMAELSRHSGAAAKRLVDLLESVVKSPIGPKRRGRVAK